MTESLDTGELRALLAKATDVAATERSVLDGLARRYGHIEFGAHRYACAEHVPIRPAYPERIADFIAVDCWRGSWADWKSDESPWTGNWGYAIHGHEVKVSRGDWLTELRDPSKAQAFKRYVDYWWLAVTDKNIVRGDELPEGWGLLALVGGKMRQIIRAPRLTPEPMPRELFASLLRATAKSARNAASRPDLSGGEQR
jgi:hypothetical protein